MSADTGKVVTVRGPIDPGELGMTMTHEHVFLDMVTGWFTKPATPEAQRLSREPVTLENLEYIRTNPLKNKDNMRLESTPEAIEELEQYARAGGKTIVDVTPKSAGADPERVRRIARATGVQFVHGTAYYTRPSHSDHVDESTVDELEEEFVSDVQSGISDTDVRAGQIGEIGLSGTIHPEEEKVLRAGANAAQRTGASLNIHPPLFGPEPSPVAALEALDVIESEGLPLDRVVVSHMDQDHDAMQDLSDHEEIAERGAYLEFDEWDAWDMYMADDEHAYPSDATRVDAVVELVESGYADRLLFSHDVCTKMQLTKYGGKGYAYIPDHVLPWLRDRGVSEEAIGMIVEENPKTILSFVDGE
jgi:phosphotriesterase-related protein